MTDATSPQPPLANVRVLDLTNTLSGPYCTLLLGELGADVMKVESPDGDVTRHLGFRRHEGMSSVFLGVNRTKRSIVLDLREPDGRGALHRLVQRADVLVHNMRAEAAARLAISYPQLRPINDRLIYCAISGFGEGGRYAARPAYDDIIQGLSGIASLDHRSGEQPRYAPTVLADKTAGLLAVCGILTALLERSRTGTGQAVEVPMFEALVAWGLLEHMGGMAFEPPLGPPGYRRLLNEHHHPYQTADGHLCVLPYTERQWQRFLSLVGRADALGDHRYSTAATRGEHIDELYKIVDESMRLRSTEEWLALLEEADIPAAPLHRLDDLFDDPHLQSVGFFRAVDHPTEGRLRVAPTPFHLSESAIDLGRPAPRLGEHSTEILREADFADAEIADLVARGITLDGQSGAPPAQ